MKKIEYRIYCDGFFKFGELRFGCSVGIVKNFEELIWRHVFLVEDFPNEEIKQVMLDNKTVMNIEFFALLNAVRVARKFKKCDFIYSDSEVGVLMARGDYKVTQEPHVKLVDQIRKIQPNHVNLLWVSRETNIKYLGH